MNFMRFQDFMRPVGLQSQCGNRGVQTLEICPSLVILSVAQFLYIPICLETLQKKTIFHWSFSLVSLLFCIDLTRGYHEIS